MRQRLLALALAVGVVGSVAAEAPDRSPRPEPRPGAASPEALASAVTAALAPRPTAPATTGSALAPRASLRPETRPGAAPVPRTVAANPTPAVGTPPMTVPPPQIERGGLFAGSLSQDGDRGLPAGGPQSELAVVLSIRPTLRPPGLEQRVRAIATRQTPSRVAQPGMQGALCGNPGLVGDRLQTITGRISGCGIAQPVRLREVNGVALSTPATVNCTTAEALQRWVADVAEPAVGNRGGGITSLRVVASYACRTRNSQSGARLSEHALGNAIDIAGIGLANGSELTVLTGWGDQWQGPILQRMHRGACGIFGTVLGPNSDRFHRDHFHFDVASYRSGSYCR